MELNLGDPWGKKIAGCIFTSSLKIFIAGLKQKIHSGIVVSLCKSIGETKSQVRLVFFLQEKEIWRGGGTVVIKTIFLMIETKSYHVEK